MSKKQVVPDIDWSKVAELGFPVIAPFVQGGIWYGAMTIDKRAEALGRLIAIAEVIPAVDLNLPKGVVLASLYDSTADTIKLLMDLVDAISEIPDSVKETLKEIKDDVTPDFLEEDLDPVKALGDVQDCKQAFKDATPSFLRNRVTESAYITQCLIRKGYGQKLIAELIRKYV